VVAGAAFRDRPTVLGALTIAGAVATVFLLFRWFTARVRESLDDASTGHERLETELAAVHEAKEEFRSLPTTTTSPVCPTAVSSTTALAWRSRTPPVRRATSPSCFWTSTTSRA
jgi:hypothetical protein